MQDANSFFTTNSYYRFSGYTYIFETFTANCKRSHVYPDKLTFSEVKNLYLFDKKLRLIILEALEEIEIATKTIMCDKLSLMYGSEFLYNEKLFKENKHIAIVDMCNKIRLLTS